MIFSQFFSYFKNYKAVKHTNLIRMPSLGMLQKFHYFKDAAQCGEMAF